MQQLKKIVRVQEWWVHILPPILLFYYIGIRNESVFSKQLFLKLFLLTLSAIITALIGYFLNDLYDIEEDKKAGKSNFVAKFPNWLKYSFIPFFLALLFGSLFLSRHYFLKNDLILFYIILSSNILLFVVYSVPPVRLKSNLWAALILDAVYSGTLFYVLAFILGFNSSEEINFFQSDNSIYKKATIAMILIWGFLRGLRNYLTHLCDDQKNDEIANANTIATKYGRTRTQLAANLHFPAETICLLFIFYLQKHNSIPVYIVIFIFLIIWLIQFLRFANSKNPWLNDMYEIWLPLIVLIQLISSNYLYYPFLILHIILFPNSIVKIYNLLDRIYFYTIFKLIGPIRNKKQI